MKKLILAFVLIPTLAFAQQLTDWRAVVDSDLSKLSMPRDAHIAIVNLMQAYERQAQAQRVVIPPPTEPPADPGR